MLELVQRRAAAVERLNLVAEYPADASASSSPNEVDASSLQQALLMLPGLEELKLSRAYSKHTLAESDVAALSSCAKLRDLNVCLINAARADYVALQMLTAVTQLTGLQLSSYGPVEAPLLDLGRLTNLRSLTIDDDTRLKETTFNLLHTSALETLGALTALQIPVSLEDGLPDSMSALRNLRKLQISQWCYPGVSRRLVPDGGLCSQLTWLRVSRTPGGVAQPDHAYRGVSISGLVSLRTLSVDFEEWCSSGGCTWRMDLLAEMLSSLTNLTALQLKGMCIVQLPDCITTLRLVALDVSCNHLTALPISPALAGLEYLNTEHNRFQTVPPGLTALTCLQHRFLDGHVSDPENVLGRVPTQACPSWPFSRCTAVACALL